MCYGGGWRGSPSGAETSCEQHVPWDESRPGEPILCLLVTSTLQPLSQFLLQEYTTDHLMVPPSQSLAPRVRY